MDTGLAILWYVIRDILEHKQNRLLENIFAIKHRLASFRLNTDQSLSCFDLIVDDHAAENASHATLSSQTE